MMCNCMTGVNEKLQPHNSKLSVSFCLTKNLSGMNALPIIQTEKINTKVRGRVMMVIPTFCPFCGDKYPRAEDIDEVQATKGTT